MSQGSEAHRELDAGPPVAPGPLSPEHPCGFCLASSEPLEPADRVSASFPPGVGFGSFSCCCFFHLTRLFLNQPCEGRDGRLIKMGESMQKPQDSQEAA
jgi:hypothetical protein